MSTWAASIQAARSLWFDYGHLRSAAAQQCIDADGRPVPWYTYPAIEYLRQLDFSDKVIFEYGSGNSTLFWGASAARVVSVEDDEQWYAALRPKLPANCEVVLEPDLDAYVDVIRRYPDGFDAIIVDGAARGYTRLKCSQAALEFLRPGGLVILDNSDWLPESARVLRESGLIQVDMTGFVPMNRHTQTTSMFLRRDFVPRPRNGRLPQPGPGAANKNWERLLPAQEPAVRIGDDTLSRVDRDRAMMFQTPEGPRRFRLLGGRDANGISRWSALADEDRQRIVIYLPADEHPGEFDRAITHAAGNWDAFRSSIRRHHRRRYVI